MRVLVCGGRTFNDAPPLWSALNAIHAETPIECVIHGGASGADFLADKWAELHGAATEVYLPDWLKHGRSAGPKRNQRMIDEARPDVVVACPGGRGTQDMVGRAKAAGVMVVVVTPR